MKPNPGESARLLADCDQRKVIRSDLDSTLLVEAAAGTGKTSELIGRIIAILSSGKAELDRIVALTFLDAAAGELKLRLRNALEEARLEVTRSSKERQRLDAALPKLEEARIGTIHSFCADLLRERPVEAGVDPRFEVAAGDTAEAIFDGVFERWFQGQVANPGEAVRRILRRRTARQSPRAILRRAAWQLAEHRDFPSPWRPAEPFDRDRAIDELVGEMEELAHWSGKGNARDPLCRSLSEIAKALDEMRSAERVQNRDYDWLEAWIGEVIRQKHWAWKAFARPDRRDFPQEELRDRRKELHRRLKEFADRVGASLAPRLRDELWPVVAAYEAAKEQAGCLDFSDLLIRARNLIRSNASVLQWLKDRFTHYLVDEFQDTDPLQVEILMLLAAEDGGTVDWRAARVIPGKLFLVGDPKQSIYRFRRADVQLYRDVQAMLVKQGARLVHLNVSFRSVPEIQKAVNAAFAPKFVGSYVPLLPYREDATTQPCVVALPVPAPYGKFRKVTNYSIDHSLPDAIAAWIEWLITQSGWTVTEREHPDMRIPVQPKHVCLLFRERQSYGKDATRPYVDALEARQIQHLTVGGSSFHDREEIQVIRTALAAIEQPDDELVVFATLRGPLMAISDAALVRWRGTLGGLHPLRIPEGVPDSLTEIAEGLLILRDLHRSRNRRPIADTITLLLEATRAHAAFAIWPTGVQTLANIGRLMVLAHAAEKKDALSFRGFVEQLETAAERSLIAEAPVLEEGVQGVRMMTVHKAKGLEFPIVILADLTTPGTHKHVERWTDIARGLCVQRLADCSPPELLEHSAEELERAREESLRVLYVACTRPRDVLVVPVVGDGRQEGWLDALHPVVYPPIGLSRKPISRNAPGLPTFGADTVASRPDDVERPTSSVVPGAHQPECGSHRIAWWDPSVLPLGAEPTGGISQMRILAANSGSAASDGITRWHNWREERSKVLEKGRQQSKFVWTATEWAARMTTIQGADDVKVEDARWKGSRPTGTRFGTLVHALLSTVELQGDRTRVEEHGKLHAALLGAADDERDAAVEVVLSALSHPLMRRAASADSGRCYREFETVVRLDDGTLIEGVVDLAFLDGAEWTVIDFKTDADLSTHEDRYKKQVAIYVMGITQASSLPGRAHLLVV